MSWKQIGIIAGALVALFTLGTGAMPVLQSDSPPWSGINRVSDSGNRIEARIVRGNILGMWRAKCEYRRAGNIALAQNVDEQIIDLQDDYVRLTGLPLQLQTCP